MFNDNLIMGYAFLGQLIPFIFPKSISIEKKLRIDLTLYELNNMPLKITFLCVYYMPIRLKLVMYVIHGMV